MLPPIIGVTGHVDQSASLPNLSLFAVGQSYVRAVELAGGVALILPPHLAEDKLRAAFERLDGLLLSGGGDVSPASYDAQDSGLVWRVDERRDRAEITLAQWALAETIPLLAICRGAQVLNVAAGGTLIQDIPTQVSDALTHSAPIASRPKSAVAHTVDVTSDSRLATLVGAGELGVNSSHHQAVETLGAGLVITARAPDGIVEGLESPTHAFCLGIQWHPEAMVESSPVMRRLFEGLIEAAQAG